MATGDTLILFTPAMAEYPTTNFPTPDYRNQVLVLDFDDTTDESCEFAGFMPRNYGGGGLTVTVGYMATSASSGTVSIDVSFKSVSDDADDLDSKAFATANNVSSTTASVSGEAKYQEITFTDGADMDSIAAGEYFRMQLNRDANGTTSTDSMTGDMELLFIEIKET